MVALAAASWGTWSLFVRPTGQTGVVTSPIIMAVIAIAALPLALREPRGRWDRTTLALLAAYTVGDVVNMVTFFTALTVTTVAIAVITHYLAPIFIALAAPRIDGARVRGTRVATLVALAGLVIVLEPWRGVQGDVLLGAALGGASAVAYAANVFTGRRLADRIGPASVMSYHAALAAVLVLPFAVSGLATVSWHDVGLLAAGASTIGALSGVAFVAGLQRIGAARTAVLTYLEPLVAVAVGALVWDEPLRPVAALGGALVLAAGIHVARQAR